ncbi:MAG: oxidoreductase [Candidatus Sumerlaeota bacterium]|nr:oxidoreductase [Candidatus Sumerlaeota bacterium]
MPDPPAKPKVALYWCASCGGCEEAVVDLAEGVLSVLNAVDIVFWPVAMDFKRRDVEALADGAIRAALLNGAIRTSEQEEMARLLRRKSQVVVAFGACAQLGGVPSLANQFDREQILDYIYAQSPTVVNDQGARPVSAYREGDRVATLPEFWRTTRALDQVIEVDYYVPGCPPTPKLLGQALATLLSDELPPKGTVLAPDTALCEECPRKDSKPEDLSVKTFKRPHLTPMDAALCFLAQGIVCMGPATRSGCEGLCIQGAMPCTGCFGPTSRVRDQGAKALSALASSVEGKEDREIESALAGIPDPVGTFYRYGLAKSLLRGKVGHLCSDRPESIKTGSMESRL